ncbi:MAG: 2-phosphosulfolactate phosphatase [Novipirellula sp. JB048]
MRLWTSLLPQSHPIEETTEIAVVIDILRATSVMNVALAGGAKQIVTTRDVDQARQIARGMPTRPLLCGERACVPIEGFDCGNSPSEYPRERVADRELVITTTNGTKAIEAASLAKEVLLGSFLNLTAVVERLDRAANVALICAGTDGLVTLEDVLFAGAVITYCQSRFENSPTNDPLPPLQLNDESVLARQTWQSWFGRDPQPGAFKSPSVDALAARLAESQGGKNVIRAGYRADLTLCAQIDSLSVVPRRISQRAGASVFAAS